MKIKKYILIVAVGIIVAGISYLNLFDNASLPYNNTINAPRHQDTDTAQDEVKNKVPLSDKNKSVQSSYNAKTHNVTESFSVEEKSGNIPAEKTDEVNAENDKNIVDRELLRKMFPDKIELMPITPEEIEARKQTILETNERFKQILTNKATEEEINLFYNEKSKLLKDRMEILKFAINEFGDKLSEDGLRRQQNTLTTLESQLDKTPMRRAKALARLKNMKTNNEES